MLPPDNKKAATAAPAKTRGMLFGVATADHQCEAYDPQFIDIRDLWEVRRGQTLRGHATDFWNRYPEDIALAKSLGCTAFRFSVAWSRVEPEPGVFNEAALAHYSQMVDHLRASGIEPVVTLHHNTHPVHIEQRGGLIGRDFPALFAAYARKVAERLGDRVTYWVTINEPTQLVFGYVKPWWASTYFMPPGMPRGATTAEQMSAVGALIPNLFLAHSAGRDAIKAVNPSAKVGTNPLLLGLPVWLQNIVDRRATKLKSLDDLVRSAQPFAERTLLLEHGDVDVIVASMSVTPERQSELAFSEGYFATDLCLAVQVRGTVTTIDALGGKVVGIVRGSSAQTVLPRVLAAADSAEFADYGAAFAALRAGDVQAVLGDRVLLESYVTGAPGDFGFLPSSLGTETYAVAMALGNRDLRNAVDLAIERFKTSGEWAQSYARHFAHAEVPAPPASARRADLSDLGATPDVAQAVTLQRATVLDRIRKRGYLIAGIKSDVPGLSVGDPQSGEFSGFEIDLARTIAHAIFGDPASVRFSVVRTGERTSALRSFAKFFTPIAKVFSMLSTMVASNWWHLGMAGRLPEFLCPTKCVGQQDFVGFDYYWGVPGLSIGGFERLGDAAIGRYASAPVWAGVLYDFLQLHAQWFPDKEIFVIENGCVDAADGVTRDEYLRRHFREVQRATHDGINIAGYICWSITSNREWGLKFDENSDFGLFHIDLDGDPALTRHATAASETYRQLIASVKPVS